MNEGLDTALFIEALRTFKKENQIDAFAFVGVDVVKAYFSNNIFSGYVASWWGQEESYLLDGAGAGDVLGSLFVDKHGYLPAVRFFIRFRDENNKLLSVGGGGIELLARFDDDGNAQYKTPEKLFDDTEELNNALMLAFKDLASHNRKSK